MPLVQLVNGSSGYIFTLHLNAKAEECRQKQKNQRQLMLLQRQWCSNYKGKGKCIGMSNYSKGTTGIKCINNRRVITGIKCIGYDKNMEDDSHVGGRQYQLREEHG